MSYSGRRPRAACTLTPALTTTLALALALAAALTTTLAATTMTTTTITTTTTTTTVRTALPSPPPIRLISDEPMKLIPANGNDAMGCDEANGDTCQQTGSTYYWYEFVR